MKKSELSATQLKAIRCILESNSIEEAARKAKVSRGTIYNWMKEEIFHECLMKERNAIFTETLDLLKQASRKAVIELINLLRSKNETTRRLAAKEILCLSLRATELRDIEERLREIEQIVELQRHNQG